MIYDSFLQLAAEHLVKLIANLASDEIRGKLKKSSNQDLLLQLYATTSQLESESKLFVSRLHQLSESIVNRSSEDVMGEQVDISDPRNGSYRMHVFVHISETQKSIKDISLTLLKIKRVIEEFSPILDIYDNKLLLMINEAVGVRDSIVSDVGRHLARMAQDVSILTLMNIEPYRLREQLLLEKFSGQMPQIKKSLAGSHKALSLIGKSKNMLKILIRKTYPSIKDLPK